MKRLFSIQHPVLLTILFLGFNGGQIHRNSNREKSCFDLEPGQKGFIQLTKSDEPGEPLVVYGKIIDSGSNLPIRDASIFLYQTDSSGIYNVAGLPDEQARIRGTLQTNESGCFKIKTILPGDYPGRKNSRHLHYVINATGYKEMRSILFFKGFTTENISRGGPLKVLDIRKEKDGSWLGSFDIRMVPTDNP